MVVDKAILRSEHLRSKKERFYSYFVSEVVKHNWGTIAGARLRIDGSGDREFKRAFQSYLRSKLEQGTIQNCKFVDSKRDSLIQLADMAAGCFYRNYHPQRGNKQFLRCLSRRVEDCWEFDKKNWPAS